MVTPRRFLYAVMKLIQLLARDSTGVAFDRITLHAIKQRLLVMWSNAEVSLRLRFACDGELSLPPAHRPVRMSSLEPFRDHPLI
jgi:hypothetical protein